MRPIESRRESAQKSGQIPAEQPDAEAVSRNIMKQCELLLAIYVLKSTTNEELALSVSEIAEQLDALLPEKDPDGTFFPERTLRRKFDILSLLESCPNPMFEQIFRLFAFVYGGRVVSREADGILTGKNTTGNGKQKRYYFDPVLSEGDMDMICGTIQSSRYLSYAEKNYLLSRLRILQPSFGKNETDINLQKYRHILQVDALPARPPRSKTAALPVDTSVFLSNVQAVHDAIENEYQIEVIYGIYDTDPAGKVTFHARNPEKPYILNPYAMMWNDGDYYLIATHGKYTNPTHFRLDRMISVLPHTESNKDGTRSEIPRHAIPPTLRPYFKKVRNHPPVFDAIAYANTYPEMKIYNSDHRINCTFECTPLSLQILIDYFGTNIRLKPSPLPHEDATTSYFAAEVRGIQYDNALSFCIMFCEQLTLLSPTELRDDVRGRLQKVLSSLT